MCVSQSRSSRQAYIKPVNSTNRESHKGIILSFTEKHKKDSFSVREIATHTKLGYRPVQKRVSDLKKEGRLSVTGTKVELDEDVEVYRFNSWQIQNTTRKVPDKKLWQKAIDEVAPLFSEAIKQRYQSLKSGAV